MDIFQEYHDVCTLYETGCWPGGEIPEWASEWAQKHHCGPASASSCAAGLLAVIERVRSATVCVCGAADSRLERNPEEKGYRVCALIGPYRLYWTGCRWALGACNAKSLSLEEAESFAQSEGACVEPIDN